MTRPSGAARRRRRRERIARHERRRVYLEALNRAALAMDAHMQHCTECIAIGNHTKENTT